MLILLQSAALLTQGGNPPHTAYRGVFRFLIVLIIALAAYPASAVDAQQIRDFLARQPDDLIYTSSLRPVRQLEVQRFYASREFRPIWKYGDRREQLEQAVASLLGDGLNPAHYRVPSAKEVDTALGEVSATAVWMQAALDLRFGRLDRSQIEPIWHYFSDFADDARALLLNTLLFKIYEPLAAIEALRPDTPVYQRLREEYLRRYRQQGQPPPAYVPPGPTLSPGDRGYRVARLRDRLRATGQEFASHFGEDYYDAELSEAVKRFQYRHSLAEDGHVGPATLAALNVTPDERLGQLRANLERWRWMTPELEDNLLLVNIAGARLKYFVNGEQVWVSRTLVGRNSRPTPALKSLVTYLTFNPDWTIPPTIFREDKQPQIQENAQFFEENPYIVVDHSGRQVDPATVNWDNPKGVLLRQRPGPENPLGQVVVRFPNPFSVYLHDTPNKALFGKVRRAGSSGCVRVEEAVDLAYLIMRNAGDYFPAEVDELFRRGEKRNVNLVTQIPILMDYWTADIDEAGRLIFQADIYDRDRALSLALEE